MNLRRYTLFLIVALLTFSIGVAAAFLTGASNPLAHSEKRRCGSRRLSSLPGPSKSFRVYTVYRSDGTILRAAEADVASDSVTPPASAFTLEPPPPPPPAPRPAR